MRLNREKVAALLAFIIFLLGAYGLVSTEVRTYDEIEIRLDPGKRGVPHLEPRLYVEKSSLVRNPFRMSSEWAPLEPPPLGPPPASSEQEPRVLFGWLAERAPGAPLPLRAAPLREAAGDAAKGGAR